MRVLYMDRTNKPHRKERQLLKVIIIISVAFIIIQCSNEKQVAKEPSGLGSILITTTENNVFFDNYSIDVGIYSYKGINLDYIAYEDPNVKPIVKTYYYSNIKIDSIPIGIYDVWIRYCKDNHSIPPETVGYEYKFDAETGDTIDSLLMVEDVAFSLGAECYQPTLIMKVRVAQDLISLINIPLSYNVVDYHNLMPGERDYRLVHWKVNIIEE
jgi:hypothetical protein